MVRLPVQQGSSVAIKVSGSADPDRDQVRLSWTEDFHATSRSGPPLDLKFNDESTLSVTIPEGQTSDLHLVLTGEDDGKPSLEAYRRVVLAPVPSETQRNDVVLGGRVLGMGMPFSDISHFKNAFDGDLKTFVDLHRSPIQYVAIDLGEADEFWRQVRQIRYFPRAGFEFRMISGEFQGANDASFNNHDVLHKVDAPTAGWNEVPVEGANAFRYLRYVGPQDGFANVAEIEFVSGGRK